MGKEDTRNVRKRRRLRRKRRDRAAAALLFPGIAAMVFAGGFLAGYSWQNMEPDKIPGNPAVYADAMPDLPGNTIQADVPEPRWNLLLVNKWNPIPDNYEVNLVETDGGEYVDERIYGPLMEMLEDAREANWDQLPLVVSGYRTTQDQQQLYEEKNAEYRKQGYSDEEAEELAQQWAAAPGYSEHQLGLAVDINGATYDVYLWLQENSYKYGFIFRYPGCKTAYTGVAEEVWHYRYVGTEAAAEIYEQGICLEEYLAKERQD